jgi:hypothetical protein
MKAPNAKWNPRNGVIETDTPQANPIEIDIVLPGILAIRCNR